MVGVAGSINSEAIGSAATSYGVSTEVMSLDTALFLVGFGVASVIWAPLSELGGRNPVYIVAFTMLILFEVGAAKSNTLYARCITRFFAGCAATPPLSNAGGGMGDIWTPAERAYAFTCFAVSGLYVHQPIADCLPADQIALDPLWAPSSELGYRVVLLDFAGATGSRLYGKFDLEHSAKTLLTTKTGQVYFCSWSSSSCRRPFHLRS
jgi:hypothetical protein